MDTVKFNVGQLQTDATGARYFCARCGERSTLHFFGERSDGSTSHAFEAPTPDNPYAWAHAPAHAEPIAQLHSRMKGL